MTTRSASAIVALATLTGPGACKDSKPTEPEVRTGPTLLLTAADISALRDTADAVYTANPNDSHLKTLADSTLGAISAGIEAKRIDLTTNLTTDPLYFVAIHRVATQLGGSSFSTWTLVGFDDPTDLENLVQVSGFAQSSTSTPPATVAGTIGDGTGVVNALMIQVGNGGSTLWHAGSGTVTFVSGTPGAACPNFVAPNANTTCALETISVQFSANATGGSGGAGARNASVPTQVQVPAIRLTYTQ